MLILNKLNSGGFRGFLFLQKYFNRTVTIFNRGIWGLMIIIDDQTKQTWNNQISVVFAPKLSMAYSGIRRYLTPPRLGYPISL